MRQKKGEAAKSQKNTKGSQLDKCYNKGLEKKRKRTTNRCRKTRRPESRNTRYQIWLSPVHGYMGLYYPRSTAASLISGIPKRMFSRILRTVFHSQNEEPPVKKTTDWRRFKINGITKVRFWWLGIKNVSKIAGSKECVKSFTCFS